MDVGTVCMRVWLYALCTHDVHGFTPDSGAHFGAIPSYMQLDPYNAFRCKRSLPHHLTGHSPAAKNFYS